MDMDVRNYARSETKLKKRFLILGPNFQFKDILLFLVEQENARPHIHLDDPNIIAAVLTHNSSSPVKMLFEPPNSPELDVIHLVLFNSIQSLQSKIMATSIE